MVYDKNTPFKYDPISLINKDLIDESITEEELSKIESDIHEALNSDQIGNKYMTLKEDDDMTSLAAMGIISVAIIIRHIIKWIRGKYTLKYKKIVDQSKEVNDMYQKIMDIVKHDKMARFKHRNDRIDCVQKNIAMVDNETKKKYYATIDELAYDSEWYRNKIESTMEYLKNNKDMTFEQIMEDLINDVTNGFEENHGYIKTCTPIATIEYAQNVKLEAALMYFKDMFEVQYQNIYLINYVMSRQLTCMQLLHTVYDNMIKRYGSDKNNKKYIDKLFKLLLNNSQLSMDFNNKVLTCISAVYENAYTELSKIYDRLRS